MRAAVEGIPCSMGNFGDRLRREREMRGITLEEISHSTKISTRHLRSLENEDFSQLPGGVFNRGFVRAYAHFLGLDEEQCVADYSAALAEHQGPLPTPDQELGLQQEQEQTKNSKGLKERFHADYRLRPLLLLLGAALVLVIGGWFGFQVYQKLRGTEPDHVDAATSASIKSTGAPESNTVSGSGASPQPTLSAVGQNPINVALHLNQASWVSVDADGKGLMANMLQHDTDFFFSAQRTMKIVLGNASGVEVSFNGKRIPLKGKVATVNFTPQGSQVVQP